MSIYAKLLDDTRDVLQSGKKTSEIPDFETLEIGHPRRHSKHASTTFDSLGSSNSKSSGVIEERESKKLPEITDWRRAEEEDKLAIRQLQIRTGGVANLLYKRKDIDELIKTSYITIVQFDSEGNLISFTAYDCYPNIPALPAFWKDWLTINYRLEGIDARNVLFIHYMVWQPEQANKFLPVLLRTVFTEFLYLKYIIVIKPPKATVPNFYSQYFIPVLPPGLEEFEYNSIQLLLLCLRSSIVHPLPIRNVFGQDLDMVMSILRKRLNKEGTWDLVNFVYQKNKKTLICEVQAFFPFNDFKMTKNRGKKGHFRLTFGTKRWYLGGQGNPHLGVPERTTVDLWKLFLTQKEKGGRMAGVMVLNLTIDLDVLNEGFDLTPFNGLRKDEFGDDGFTFPANQKKTFSMDLKSNISIPESRIMFPNINWENIGGLEGTDDSKSSSVSPLSSVSFSFYRSISQFSLLRLGSIIEVKKGEDEFRDMFPTVEDINVMVRKAESTLSHFFPPKYFGPTNAFVIDFFALDCARIDEKLSSFDFLEAAFRVVPDRDYCILLIPTDFIPFPLMDLFIRVTPKLMTSIKQELYLFHKNLLSVNSIAVRPAQEDDMGAIAYFLKDVDEGGIVYQDILHESLSKSKEFKTFILTVQESIVGVSLINSQAEEYHMYFEVSDVLPSDKSANGNLSVIKHLVINPIYYNHTHFFIRDIMRLADVDCVFYTEKKSSKVLTFLSFINGNTQYDLIPSNRTRQIRRKPERFVCVLKNEWPQKSLITSLGEFAPLHPKKKAGLLNLHPDVNFPDNTKRRSLCSLYFLTPPLCGFQKTHLNIIIVVVGASRTALSFLESLIYGPASYLYKYNNLVCVTPQDMKADHEEENLRDLMFPIRDNFSRNHISMLSLEAYVHFIYGTMTAINRTEKYIIINNRTFVRYDYLILTCGLQYLSPKSKTEMDTTKNCRNTYKSSLARFMGTPILNKGEEFKPPDPNQPSNMFIINSSKDAQRALRSLQPIMQKLKTTRKTEKKIIVYGHHLQVFLTIHTLLKLGIPGEIIVFVEPFPSSGSVTLFNDRSVDQAVLQSVIDCKVVYYTEYFLYDWSTGSEDNISNIKFHSKYKQIDIPCLAFFPFIEKLVSDVTFNACNNAGLVYDGRLVINHNFRTNDRYIYAAGTFTKYARRYYANEFCHEYYNSREVGQKLAGIMRKVLDPKVTVKTEETSYLVPKLIAPVHVYCQIGDFNLFMLRKPGKMIDLETAYNISNYGEVLTTGDCQMKKGPGYFRLHLNPEGFVESITCYTKEKIDYVNLSALYGLHEKILNNLLYRFDMAMINDLFEYFRQPWALALFHDNFHCLRHYNYEAFFQETSDNQIFFNRVIEELKSNKWETLPESVVQELVTKYTNSKIQEDIKDNLMEFLECFKKDLPIYATTSLLERWFKTRSEMSHFDQP